MTETVYMIIAICGAVGAVFGAIGVTAYLSERAKHKAQKQNQAEDETCAGLKELEQQKMEKRFRAIIREEVSSIIANVNEIKANLVMEKEATIKNMRSQLKSLRDEYERQGYADEGDKATWNELFETYGKLGGNHFKEWVNVWKEDVNGLPSEKKSKPRTTVKKPKSKTILLEQKQ